MKESVTYITTATVRFYENLYRFPPNYEKFTWIIKLEDCPLCSVNNRICISISNSFEDSRDAVKALKHHLALNHIFDGSKATIVFNSGDICAIGTNGKDNYCDTKDDFKAKTFAELGINITSLVVANF